MPQDTQVDTEQTTITVTLEQFRKNVRTKFKSLATSHERIAHEKSMKAVSDGGEELLQEAKMAVMKHETQKEAIGLAEKFFDEEFNWLWSTVDEILRKEKRPV